VEGKFDVHTKLKLPRMGQVDSTDWSQQGHRSHFEAEKKREWEEDEVDVLNKFCLFFSLEKKK
jgi:hypothetical protein